MHHVPNPRDVAEAAVPVHLLIWDAPNVDMTLSSVIGRRPTSATRPRYDAVAEWFVAGAGDQDVQGAVFTNYADGTAGHIRPWLEAVRTIGFDVFVKPKHDPEDDIDGNMIAHIRHTRASRRLARLVVVSGDGRAFEEELEQVAGAGVDVVVISFDEVASWARQAPSLTFMDLEDIPGAFKEPLVGRIRLETLPAEGAWMPATGSLRMRLADSTPPEPVESHE